MYDYKAAFRTAVEQVKGEGRYRVFADLKRVRGQLPKAIRRRADGTEQDVVVWCSNDYLGMGQHPAVLEAMQAEIDAVAPLALHLLNGGLECGLVVEQT